MIDLKELEERVILAAVSTSETDMAERSLEELKERIEKDKEFALKYFAENPLYNPVKI